MNQENRKRIFSAIQPSGTITLGNYLGAIKNWIPLQEDFDCLFAVADLHAITVRQLPADLRKNSLKLIAFLLACGIDPEKSILYCQSHVAAHSQLAWILNCYTQMGELQRMTQFKDKSAKHANNINAGLFTYPVLMAADILLYQADMVPVGHDQKQHLELCRDIATRFNGVYGDVFKIPEPYIQKTGARIMSLQNPLSKMSKSDENVNSYIAFTDDTDTIIRKFKRAVTDSDTRVYYGEGKDGINNLMSIYGAITGKSNEEIEKEFDGKGYGDFKLAVGEAVASTLAPIQAKYNDLLNNKDYLESVYKSGAEKAARLAFKTLAKVSKKVGFII